MKLEFKAKFDATLHGFSGYFDSHLYRDIDISINNLFNKYIFNNLFEICFFKV